MFSTSSIKTQHNILSYKFFFFKPLRSLLYNQQQLPEIFPIKVSKSLCLCVFIITILSTIIISFKKELLKQTSSFPEFYSHEVQWNSVNMPGHYGDMRQCPYYPGVLCSVGLNEIYEIFQCRDNRKCPLYTGVPIKRVSLILILYLTSCVLVILSSYSYFEFRCFLSLNSDLCKTNINFSKDF